MAVSTNLFSVRNLKIEFQRQDLETFNSTDLRVTRQKIGGVSVAPFSLNEHSACSKL